MRGEEWLRDTLGTFVAWLPIPLTEVDRSHIVQFLGQYDAHPFRKHSMYRALHTFFHWVSVNYQIPNPFLDQWGNSVIDAPKVPTKVLNTMTPEKVATLIEAAPTLRDAAFVALLADSGARLSELVGGRRGETPCVQVTDVDLVHRRIRCKGKGNKEGWLVFGPQTAKLLAALMERRTSGKLFELSYEGATTMLQRLGEHVGFKCNAHSFRRGFATELRRKGLGELDIMELGRWSSTAMVKRYSRAFTFDDAAVRYQPIVN